MLLSAFTMFEATLLCYTLAQFLILILAAVYPLVFVIMYPVSIAK